MLPAAAQSCSQWPQGHSLQILWSVSLCICLFVLVSVSLLSTSGVYFWWQLNLAITVDCRGINYKCCGQSPSASIYPVFVFVPVSFFSIFFLSASQPCLQRMQIDTFILYAKIVFEAALVNSLWLPVNSSDKKSSLILMRKLHKHTMEWKPESSSNLQLVGDINPPSSARCPVNSSPSWQSDVEGSCNAWAARSSWKMAGSVCIFFPRY